MPLTDTLIRALKPRQSRYLVTDGRGLCLEVLPSGKFSWLFPVVVRSKTRLEQPPSRLQPTRYLPVLCWTYLVRVKFIGDWCFSGS